MDWPDADSEWRRGGGGGARSRRPLACCRRRLACCGGAASWWCCNRIRLYPAQQATPRAERHVGLEALMAPGAEGQQRLRQHALRTSNTPIPNTPSVSQTRLAPGAEGLKGERLIQCNRFNHRLQSPIIGYSCQYRAACRRGLPRSSHGRRGSRDEVTAGVAAAMRSRRAWQPR